MKKLGILLFLILIAVPAFAGYKFNPFTGKMDYYEPGITRGQSVTLGNVSSIGKYYGDGSKLTGISAQRVINIKNYGVAGDGVTDDTAAIQAIINAYAAIGGGIRLNLYFPEGVYLISSSIDMKADLVSLSIYGDGFSSSPSVASGTVIRATATMRQMLFGCIKGYACQNVTFSGFRLDGNNLAAIGLNLRSSSRNTYNFGIINCTEAYATFSAPAAYSVSINYPIYSFCNYGDRNFMCLADGTLGHSPPGSATSNAYWQYKEDCVLDPTAYLSGAGSFLHKFTQLLTGTAVFANRPLFGIHNYALGADGVFDNCYISTCKIGIFDESGYSYYGKAYVYNASLHDVYVCRTSTVDVTGSTSFESAYLDGLNPANTADTNPKIAVRNELDGFRFTSGFVNGMADPILCFSSKSGASINLTNNSINKGTGAVTILAFGGIATSYGPTTNYHGNQFIGAVTLPPYNTILDGVDIDTAYGESLSLIDSTANNASISKHGFMPKLDGDATHFYSGAGTQIVPPRQAFFGASAHYNGNQNITTGVETLVTLDTVDFASNVVVDTSAHTVTIQTAGTYQAAFFCRWVGNGTGARYIALYKNGVLVYKAQLTIVGAAVTASNAGPVIYSSCVPGDYFTITVNQTSGGDLLCIIPTLSVVRVD